jgi:ElaB/YqjD/DUF883 family membrane-anchored ribosome-binding protein
MDSETGEARMSQGLPLPVEVLEKRARDQRDLLQGRVVELRRTVKDRFDVKRNVREHVWPSAGIAALLGLALGFAVSGLFTRR